MLMVLSLVLLLGAAGYLGGVDAEETKIIGVRTDDPRCADVTCDRIHRPITATPGTPSDPTTCANGTYCPRCLTDQSVWKPLLDALGTGTAIRTAKPALLINNWLSAELTDNIANILLQEVMGFTVDTVPIGTSSNIEVVCCKDTLIELEMWENDIDDDNYFTLKTGSIGYSGESGLFVPPYTEAAFPLATAYNAYNYLPEYRDILPRGMSTNCTDLIVDQALGCVEGNYWCDEGPKYQWTNTTCIQGRYIPPQCQADPTNCSEVYMADPTWDSGFFEGTIKNTGLPFITAYIGLPNYATFLHQQYALGKHFMFYWYIPDPLTTSLGGQIVNFKTHNVACELKRTADPTTTQHDCGYPVKTLAKWARRDTLSQDVDLEFFFERYQLTVQDLEVMMQAHTEGGGAQQVWNLTCEWVRNNYATWKDMVKNTGPEVLDATSGAESGSSVLIVAVVTVAALLVAALIVFVALRRRSSAAVQYAPKDVTAKYCAMFVSLEDETLHWEQRGEQMPTLMRKYHETMDRVAKRNCCYVVKNVGGAILVVSVSANSMLSCAAEVSVALKEVTFSGNVGNTIQENAGGDEIASNTSAVSKSHTTGHRRSSGQAPSVREDDASAHGSHPSSSRHKTYDCVARFSVGLHYDHGMIHYDESRHHYDFNGPPVDGAARASDKAQGGQILVTNTVASAIMDEKASSSFDESHFDEFCHCSWGKDMTLLQFNPPGARTYVFNHLKGSKEQQKVDSIASALEQQSTGVTQKKVTVVSLILPSLLPEVSDLSREAFAKSYAAKWAKLQAIVATEKGHIVSVVGARVLLSFNAAHPCPNTAHRAFLTVQTLLEDVDPDLTAGIAQEHSIVGRFPVAGGGHHEALLSKVAETATFLQDLTAQYPRGSMHCLTHDGLHGDVCTFAVEEFVDFVQLPGAAKPRILIALHRLQPPGEDDEWMYELEQQSKRGEFGVTNQIFSQVAQWQGAVPSSAKEGPPLCSGIDDVPETSREFIGFANLVLLFAALNDDRDRTCNTSLSTTTPMDEAIFRYISIRAKKRLTR